MTGTDKGNGTPHGPTMDVDVVVIGAGPVGENVADRARRHGLTATIVESWLAGGECSYYACIPSKALLRPVDVLAAARRVPGVPVGPVDVPAVLARRDRFAAPDDSGQAQWLADTGIALLRGHGRLAGERTVQVDHADGTVTTVHARAVVVATGSVPAIPPVDGLADVAFWTNREATQAKAVPESLLVLGGGVVGVELATARGRSATTSTTWQPTGCCAASAEPGSRRCHPSIWWATSVVAACCSSAA